MIDSMISKTYNFRIAFSGRFFMLVKNRPAMWVAAVLYLAAISAFAQAAAPTAPATLTSQEREAALKQFEATRDNFLKSIAGLSQAQWTFKPAPDRWSVAEFLNTSRYQNPHSSGWCRSKS
jgi:DinB superfamily